MEYHVTVEEQGWDAQPLRSAGPFWFAGTRAVRIQVVPDCAAYSQPENAGVIATGRQIVETLRRRLK